MFNTVLARLGLVAAILATLLILAPAASAADAEYNYAEDREDAVATFSAADPDADAGDIEWSVSGVDADFFEISDDGELTFKEQPDFETPEDKDEIADTVQAGPQGAGDNVYQVTVVASEGELEVAVTVTDVDEDGKVTIDQPQPQATRPLEASGTGDPDGGVDEISWQWSRGATKEGPWTDIAGATSTKFTPTTDDIGSYLRATVTYIDVHGDQSVSDVTDNVVEARTLANAAPEFDDDIDPIEVDENTSGNIGEPIVATDDDNDELLYDVDTASTTDDPNDNALFDVDNNGQLSLKEDDGLNFEADPTTSTTDAADTETIIEYTVELRATDPSGASDTVTVMVHLMNVNEAPEFQAPSKDQTTLYIAEDGTTEAERPPIFTSDGLDSDDAVEPYQATDEDGETLDSAVTYSLEGDDKDSFSIDETTGALTTLQEVTGANPAEGLKANFEDKSSYSITIVAQSTDATPTDDDERGTKYTRLDVTVKVVNREDTGKVTLSARQSQEDIPVVATHSDEDGGVTDRKWQWYRGGSLPDDLGDLFEDDGSLTTTATGNTACVNADPDDDTVEPTAATDLCRIDGEAAALYTPDSNDVGRMLHAVADYKDDFSADVREQAAGSSEATVQESNPANTAPAFPDQDLGTPGDQLDMAMRSVAENEDKGTKVGEPIPAGDDDKNDPTGNMELLTYTIDDTDNFSVDQKNGQISTAVKLDHETQSMYTVMLTATDPSGASATITVMIEVTDEDDPATIMADAEYDYAEDREDAVATFSASDPDADAGDIEWSLKGVDADFFEISDDGELTFKEQPDFETPEDKDEIADTVQAGPQGAGDNVYQVTVVASDGELEVAVTVTDVDEDGKVTIDQPQPQATRSLEASGTGDPDGGVDEISWQWSRGATKEGPWTDIAGATSTKFTPTTDDIGSYLRATVTYIDVHGDQSVSGVTDNVVEARTLANAAPEFDDDIDPIEVDENTSGNIGEPIVATDDDNDELLYDVDTASTTDDPNDNALFDVDNNGQLSLKEDDGLNFEADPTTSTTDAADTETIIEYTVELRATDPSGASGTVTVMVHLMNVNEAPEFQAPSKDQTTLYIAEDGTTEAERPPIFTSDGLDSDDAVEPYQATDEDGETLDSAVTYSLEGDDKDSFAIDETTGALTTLQEVTGANPAEGLKANFEDKSSYSITIVAQSTDATPTDDDERGTKYTRLDVTVKVVNREDTGKVTLSARQSQEDIPVVATHSDEDGGVTDRRWQWYRGGSLPDDLGDLFEDDGSLTTTATGNTACVNADPDDDTVEPTAATDLCRIDGETAALYTPDSNDVGRMLHAVADYKDDFSADVREQAAGSSEATVQESNPANTAPAFPDQDLGTPGDQLDMAMRSVAENEDKGTKVGEPIPADDKDKGNPEGNMELLTYTIDDTDNFSVDQKNGQISTAVKLDHETQSMYTVMLTATDPSGASARITVMIEVTDEDDAAIISPNRSPVFDEGETAEREVAENSEAGTAVGAPVTATDADEDDLTYSLGGDDAMYFAIDDMGQITVGEGTMLDYESDKKTYMVTVTADDGTGEHNATGSIDVTIMVKDVNDYSPMFDAAETGEREIAENSEAGTAVGDPLVATDGDGEDVTYSLGGDDAMYFAVGEDTGQITVGEGTVLDYESDKKMYMVTVTANDGTGADNATGSIAVTIMVTDVNDYSPMFESETTELMVAENTAAGMPVGDPLIATDGDGEDVTYSLSGDDAMYFAIGEETGQIAVGEGTMLDYESDKKTYMVTVTADDGTGSDNATGSIAVTIMVIDNTPPAFPSATASRSVEENQDAGTAVGDPVTASDVEGDTVIYTLSESMYFEIDGEGQITTTMMLDYETMDSHTVTVTASNGEGSDSIEVTIMVIDNTPPAFASDTAEVMVEENQEAGTAVGDPVTASDVEGDTVTYLMESMYFQIDGEGQITTRMKLDYEAMASHTVSVTASNGEGSDSIEVTIMVIDNTPPAFPSATANRSVEESQDAGTAVGDPITASDVEGDTVTYSMESMYFEIDGEGQITTTMMLDYETMDSHTVTVTASNGEGSDSIEVTIRVIDNPPPAFPSATANRRVDENLYAGATVGDPVAASDVEGDTVTYSIDGSDYFDIDTSTGQIMTTMKLDEEAMSSHSVTVTATDSGGETDSVRVAITVNDSQPGCDTVGDMGLVNDCEALLDSEDALGGSLNWANDRLMSDWGGVTMSGGRVTAIDLRDQGLDGTIPGALGRLSELTSLNLRSNADLAGDIPGSLNYLSNLTVLNLHSNSHTGEIPDLSGTSLVELYLPGNDLTGGVPAWLNGMTDMTELWLWGNSLSGTVPDLSGMTSLNKLKLNGNTALTGIDAAKLPDGLRWLVIGQTDIGANAPDLSGTSLTTLWMNETGLSGVIPVAAIPSSVTSLNLKDNSLSGAIPDMSGLVNLRYLRLHRNELSGDMPGTMGDLESIERIWIYDNELTGIAASFAKAADTLTHLYLSGNSFAEGTCLPGGLDMVANNDFAAAGLTACSQ